MRILAVLMALLVGGGAAGVAAQPAPGSESSGAPAGHARFTQDMDAGMARMMQDMHAATGSGNPDIDFLTMMIPHHVGAVDMARLVLQHGRDPATRQLAQEILAGQTSEIESMQRRLAVLRQSSSAGQEPEFPPLGGTRGP
ncbi:MAG: DUF305 domain-containing protein [Polaromonas sp.]|nr:DUF305 domain-containing protein [Polaromonas sp.]